MRCEEEGSLHYLTMEAILIFHVSAVNKIMRMAANKNPKGRKIFFLSMKIIITDWKLDYNGYSAKFMSIPSTTIGS